MKYRFQGKITFDADAEHPDFPCMEKSKGLEFSDVYTMDSDYFYNSDAMEGYKRGEEWYSTNLDILKNLEETRGR